MMFLENKDLAKKKSISKYLFNSVISKLLYISVWLFTHSSIECVCLCYVLKHLYISFSKGVKILVHAVGTTGHYFHKEGQILPTKM